ncbi:MAG: hypothetical protein Q8Q15_04510 [bacterium]|nr:hypothetical protein [bacterium]
MSIENRPNKPNKHSRLRILLTAAAVLAPIGGIAIGKTLLDEASKSKAVASSEQPEGLMPTQQAFNEQVTRIPELTAVPPTETPEPSPTPKPPETPTPTATAPATATSTATATERAASPTTAPTVAPTRLVAPEILSLSLERYAIYTGDLKNAGSKVREGGIIISYLPDLPDQVNKVFAYIFVGRSGGGYLFAPQSIKRANFEEFEARGWSKKEGFPEGVLGNTKLRAEVYSPKALSGQINFPWTPVTFTFNTTLGGSGKNPLLDTAVELYIKQLDLGPGAVMNRDGMVQQLARVQIVLP